MTYGSLAAAVAVAGCKSIVAAAAAAAGLADGVDDGGGDPFSIRSCEEVRRLPWEPHSPFQRFSPVCGCFRSAAVAAFAADDDAAVDVGQQQVYPFLVVAVAGGVGFYPEPQN